MTTDADDAGYVGCSEPLSRRGIESSHGRMRASRGGRAVRVSLSKNRIKAVQRLNALRGRCGAVNDLDINARVGIARRATASGLASGAGATASASNE